MIPVLEKRCRVRHFRNRGTYSLSIRARALASPLVRALCLAWVYTDQEQPSCKKREKKRAVTTDSAVGLPLDTLHQP